MDMDTGSGSELLEMTNGDDRIKGTVLIGEEGGM
jgi:hypothetical protein